MGVGTKLLSGTWLTFSFWPSKKECLETFGFCKDGTHRASSYQAVGFKIILAFAGHAVSYELVFTHSMKDPDGHR